MWGGAFRTSGIYACLLVCWLISPLQTAAQDAPGQYRIGVVRIIGAQLDSMRVSSILRGLEGNVLDPARVDSVVSDVLLFYERAGFVGSTVQVESVELREDGLHLTLTIKEGYRPWLLGLLVSGETTARPAYIERVLGLRRNRRLSSFDSVDLRERLLRTGLFDVVEPPLLVEAEDSSAVVQVILQDRAPGSFDLALGYLPAGANRSGSVVGSGNILLRNLFGGGRTIDVELDRLPDQASSLSASLSDPFLFGSDMRGDLRFHGYQQDSTYSRQDYEVGLSLNLGQIRLTARASRGVVRPGTGGLTVVSGTQLIPDSRSRFAGIGLEFSELDRPSNPRRGLVASVGVLRGRKALSGLEVAGGDSTRIERGFTQDRIEGRLRWYRALTRSLVLVSGVDVNAVVSERVDPSDLYRLGGAKSLRGYDEDRFRGEAVGRGLVELRRDVEAGSFAYTFFDLGFVDLPEFADASGARWYPGFGIGVQLETAAGQLDVSYAMNTEEGLRNGRVHMRIAFGL